MILLYLILIYNILYLFVYFVILDWLGGAKFTVKDLFIYWIISPIIFCEVIKDFSISLYYILQGWVKHLKYRFTHRHTKRIYDPYLNEMITVRKTS